jgi:hypothetical protein
MALTGENKFSTKNFGTSGTRNGISTEMFRRQSAKAFCLVGTVKVGFIVVLTCVCASVYGVAIER